jgi:hypothetical protein
MRAMEYEIRYYSEVVQDEIFDLPDTLAARYVVLTRRMVALGPNQRCGRHCSGVLLHAGGSKDRDVAQFGEEDQPHTRARVGHCDESLERGET